MVNVHVPLLLRVVYIHQVYSRTNAPEPKIFLYIFEQKGVETGYAGICCSHKLL